MAIRSFRDKGTENFWGGARIARFQAFQAVAIRKLQVLHAAKTLADLARVPGNYLEPLKSDRKGQHSLRINDKWRICFRWEQPDTHEVEITNHYK
jgi:toxin HigB-1